MGSWLNGPMGKIVAPQWQSRRWCLGGGSCELRVASCELRVASCELRVVGCGLGVGGWGLWGAGCGLRVAGETPIFFRVVGRLVGDERNYRFSSKSQP